MAEAFIVGGARVGWVSATWPFAQLSSDRRHLELSCLGKYKLTPDQVVSIEPYGRSSFLGAGIRINHNRNDFPENIVFLCFSSERALRAIIDSGFVPKGVAVPRPAGFAVRWSILITAFVVWNALFLADMGFELNFHRHELGLYSSLAVVSAFAGLIALRVSPRIQRVVLRPGHVVGEISSSLKLLTVISGLLSLALGIDALSRALAG